jgi:hypothetical protein
MAVRDGVTGRTEPGWRLANSANPPDRTLTEAAAINPAVIAGQFQTVGGRVHGFVLDPIPLRQSQDRTRTHPRFSFEGFAARF